MRCSDYIGIPYQERGRSFDGVDCWGLVCLMYRDMDIDVPDYLHEYITSSNIESVAGAINKNKTHWRKVEAPEVGDVLVFNIMGFPCHVGVYVGQGDFIHSFRGTAVCVERLNSLSWTRRLSEVYRWQR
jgi:cell wall-associated NlpC family hydrolase